MAKEFIHYSWKDFEQAVDTIVRRLKQTEIVSQCGRVYGIPRGGLVLAVTLSHRLGMPLATLDEVVAHGDALVVDDISDTGRTLQRFGPLGACTATLHLVPGTIYVPNIWVEERAPANWVIYPWEEVPNGKT